MIRSILLTLMVAFVLPMALKHPHGGLLLWEWFTMMHPHKMVYGFATYLQFNMIIALVTIGAWLFNKSERKMPDIDLIAVLIFIFVVWMFLAQWASLRPDYSQKYFDRFFRIMIYAGMMLVMTNTRWRIHAVIWVYGISLSYYAIRGGGFTLTTGGSFLVFGPANSILEDNNHLALALAMSLPLLNYLRLHSRMKLLQIGLTATIVLAVIAIFGTHSRGGFIGLVVMGAFFWWYSKTKIRLLIFAAIAIIPAAMFMPAEYYDRLATIGHADADASFQGRVGAWKIAFYTALHNPLTGAGFRVPYLQEIADMFTPTFYSAKAAHSIYFEILGSMGFVGLFLYLAIAGFTLLRTMRINREVRKMEELKWADDLAKMIRATLLTYFVAGASMSVEFYDGYWTLVAVTSTLFYVVKREKDRITKEKPAEEPPNRRGRRHSGKRRVPA